MKANANKNRKFYDFFFFQYFSRDEQNNTKKNNKNNKKEEVEEENWKKMCFSECQNDDFCRKNLS